MKRITAAALTLVLSAPTAVYAAGIPVIDGANLTETVAMVKSMGEQLKTMQDQLDTVKKQYSTITNMYNEARGITQHATMLTNTVEDIHGFFPTVEYDISDLLSGPLNTVATGLRKAKEMFSFETLKKEGSHLPSMEIYKERGDVVYGYMSAAKESYDSLAARRAVLNTFVTAASTANTEKAILDLNTRISAEMLLMLNDIGMIQSLTLMAQMDQARVDHNESGLALYEPIETIPGTPDLSASESDEENP